MPGAEREPELDPGRVRGGLIAVAVIAFVAVAALAVWSIQGIATEQRGLAALRDDPMADFMPPASRTIGTVDTTENVTGDAHRGTIVRSFVVARGQEDAAWRATVARAKAAGWTLTEAPVRDDGRARGATGRREIDGVRDARLELVMGTAFDDPVATSPSEAPELHLSVSVTGRATP